MKKGCDQTQESRYDMTKREFMEMVVAGKANEEMAEFAKAEIEKMDARNAKRSATPSKKALANEPIKAEIRGYLSECEEVKIASEIAEHVGVSVQKASALCRQMVADELLTSEEVKVKGKGKVKGYKFRG